MNTGHEDLSLDRLIELLQADDLVIRVHAALQLRTMGEEAAPAVPILVGMLVHGDDQDRKLAAMTLAALGPAAIEAVPALLEAANDEDETISELAIEALEEIDLIDDEPEAEAA